MAMNTNTALDIRVSRLETNNRRLEDILAHFITNTEHAFLRLTNDTHELKDEMKDFKDEMLNFKDEMKDFKDEMKEFKDEMKEFKDEMKEWREEVDRERKEMNRKWGDLANKMGTIAEDIVAPNITKIAERYFKCHDIEDFMVRRMKRKPGEKGKRKEFDVIAVCQDKVIYVEVKSTPKPNMVEQFAEFVNRDEFTQYFPEYKDKAVIPVFASLYLNKELIDMLSKRRVYAMAMNDETMDIQNFNKLEKA